VVPHPVVALATRDAAPPTIAVGGFIGVPGLMYIIGATSIVASATELVIAFVMGLGGTLIWAYYGMVDIRLVMIILAGSLFGVQLGAIGTTYVKDYMIKYVMALIMLIVAVSRFFAIPKYLNELHVTSFADGAVSLMTQFSFGVMCFALLAGATIILVNLFKARSYERVAAARGVVVRQRTAGIHSLACAGLDDAGVVLQRSRARAAVLRPAAKPARSVARMRTSGHWAGRTVYGHVR